MEPREYLDRTGVQVDPATVRDCQRELWGVLQEAREASVPGLPRLMDKLYLLPQPKLEADGTQVVPGALSDAPYDLATVLGGRDPRNTSSLVTLGSVLEKAAQRTGSEWLGVFQARATLQGPRLVKVSARGVPTQAEFPLTAAWAAKSNVVEVALGGRANVVQDVKAHLAAGGHYFVCDASLKAEACLPVLDKRGVVAVLNAEHSAPGVWNGTRLSWLVALALELPPLLPPGGVAASPDARK